MTTREIIEEAREIASMYLEVSIVGFEVMHDFEQNIESASLTVFFKQNKTENNFTVNMYTFRSDEEYSIRTLLERLKAEAKCRKPNSAAISPDDVEIDLHPIPENENKNL